MNKIPKYPIGYDKDSVPNAIKRGKEKKNIAKKMKHFNDPFWYNK